MTSTEGSLRHSPARLCEGGCWWGGAGGWARCALVQLLEGSSPRIRRRGGEGHREGSGGGASAARTCGHLTGKTCLCSAGRPHTRDVASPPAEAAVRLVVTLTSCPPESVTVTQQTRPRPVPCCSQWPQGHPGSLWFGDGASGAPLRHLPRPHCSGPEPGRGSRSARARGGTQGPSCPRSS